MSNWSPITPPDELFNQWFHDWRKSIDLQATSFDFYVATQAAQWGADQALEACCEWLETGPYGFSIAGNAPDLIGQLRASRRPKPPSLAKRALHILGTHGDLSCAEHDTIRLALEALSND